MTYPLDKSAQLYIREIVQLGVSIVYDRDPQFTSRYLRSLQKVIGTTLNFSTAFDPRVQWAVGKDESQSART